MAPERAQAAQRQHITLHEAPAEEKSNQSFRRAENAAAGRPTAMADEDAAAIAIGPAALRFDSLLE